MERLHAKRLTSALQRDEYSTKEHQKRMSLIGPKQLLCVPCCQRSGEERPRVLQPSAGEDMRGSLTKMSHHNYRLFFSV